MPEPPLQVGTVIAVAAGVVTVELPGEGGLLKVRGNLGGADVGRRVFVRYAVVEAMAPNLPRNHRRLVRRL